MSTNQSNEDEEHAGLGAGLRGCEIAYSEGKVAGEHDRKGWRRGRWRTYTERFRSSLIALISIFLRPILAECQMEMGIFEVKAIFLKGKSRGGVVEEGFSGVSRVGASRSLGSECKEGTRSRTLVTGDHERWLDDEQTSVRIDDNMPEFSFRRCTRAHAFGLLNIKKERGRCGPYCFWRPTVLAPVTNDIFPPPSFFSPPSSHGPPSVRLAHLQARSSAGPAQAGHANLKHRFQK